MTRVLLVLAFAVLLLPATAQAGVFSEAPTASRLADDTTVLPPGFTETTVWSGLYPTVLRFAPDGKVFVGDKDGLVYEFDSVDDPTPTVFADLRGKVYDGWDRGLLGLAIDPNYSNGRPYVYVTYTYDKAPDSPLVPRWNDGCPTPPGYNDDGCVVTGRLSRLDPDGTEHVLIEDWCNQFPSHSIGSLNFGPDGALYISGGDGASYDFADYGQTGIPRNPCGDPPGGAGTALTPPTALGGALRSQSFRRPDSLPAVANGAILRVNPDTGAALPDNPAAASSDPERRKIVAYGFRNPFRFTFRPGTSELWVGDVGWSAWEEIDRVPDVSQVRNYGWPCYEGAVRQDSYEAVGLDSCEQLYSEGSALVPYWSYSHHDDVVPGESCPLGSSSLSGIAFYDGAQFPTAYRDALFFADYSRMCIWVMFAGADGLPDPSTIQTFASGTPGPVDLEVGPDGALYYPAPYDGTIRRISANTPVAKIGASATSGTAPLTVEFDGSGSTDPAGAALSYTWDLDGDGTFGDSTDAKPSFTYTHNGVYTVRLRVGDAAGTTGTTTQTITVGPPPTVHIDTPSATTTWAVGDTIGFSGSATDGSGNELPASALRWGLDLRHCWVYDLTSCHTHHIGDFDGVASGSFVAPDHEYPSHLELSLTATDADGLSSKVVLPLYPHTADITVDTAPAGLKVGFGSEAPVTPFTRTVLANSALAVSAESPQSWGAASYVFGSWSDGGAQTHAIHAPASGTASYSATYAPVPDTRLAGTDAVNAAAVSTAFPGRGEVYRTTATVTGAALAVRLYLDGESTASKLTLGIYADVGGEAGALLGSGTLFDPVAGAWNEVRLATGVTLTAGTRYWFALLNPSDSAGPLRWHDRAGAPADFERTSASLTLDALPDLWQSQFFYEDGGPLSAEAYGPVPGAPTPTPTPTATATATPAPLPATPTPAPTPAPAPKPKPKPLPKVTAPASLARSRSGAVPVALSCPAAAPADCRLTVTLADATTKATVARASVRLRAGKRTTVHLKLATRARSALRSQHRLRVRVTVARTIAPAKAQSASRTLTLRP
jgi:glucose/arabinose dehydrogenase